MENTIRKKEVTEALNQLNKGFQKRAIESAQYIERNFGFPTSVIALNSKSKIPWVTGPDSCVIYIIAPQSEHQKLYEKIQQTPQIQGHVIYPMFPLNEMLKQIQAHPEMLKRNMGGMGIIPPFFSIMKFMEIMQNHSEKNY
jgi:hypothetical protein